MSNVSHHVERTGHRVAVIPRYLDTQPFQLPAGLAFPERFLVIIFSLLDGFRLGLRLVHMHVPSGTGTVPIAKIQENHEIAFILGLDVQWRLMAHTHDENVHHAFRVLHLMQFARIMPVRIIKLNPHARLHVVQTNLTAHWEPP